MPSIARGALAAALAALAVSLAASAGGRSVLPDDPYWPAQQSLRQIGVPTAWGVTTGDPAVLIAVVDTGVEPLPDLAGALVPGWDFVDGDELPGDTHGHGTAVASIIAARGADGAGIAGICWACRILPVRVAKTGTTTTDQLALGIRWAAEHGARIVNVSLEGEATAALADAVSYAQSRGALVIASAGNAGNARPVFPAAYRGVLAVAATDRDDRLYPWSTRGNWVSLAAPGCSVVDNTLSPPGSLCGTSLTPALVTGVAGLLLSAAPGLDAASLAAVLEATAVPVDGIAGGRIDAAAAIRAVTGGPPPVDTPAGVSEARLLSGTLRRTWRVALQLEPGPLDAELHARRLTRCRIEVRTPAGIVVALPSRPDEIRLAETVVAAGRHVLTIACPDTASRPFTLVVYAAVRR